MSTTCQVLVFGFYSIKLADKNKAEAALCLGWIDEQTQRIDDKSYKKYFSMRRAKSK